jgi:hypothetical protein
MDLEIPLLPVQREFLQAKEDFVALVSSRSCGKTWIGVLDAVLEVLRGNNILYMCQNDGAWYKGGWVHLKSFLRMFNLEDQWSWNGTYKTGTLCGKKFYVGTYENVDGARGATECSTLYLDEFMLSKPSIMAALAPCLRGKDANGNDVNPRIRAFSSPNMESLWQLMIVEHDRYGIRLLRSKLKDNVFVSEKQKQVMAAAIFDEKLRRQEIDGEIIIGDDATSIISLKDFPREAPYFSDDHVYAGLDMAHTGQRDSHSFAAIKGNRLVAFHEFGKCDALSVATWIRKFNKVYPIDQLNMDLAWSESVHDQLQYEIPCTQISFAEKAPDEAAQRRYGNIRAFGYFKLAKMHREGLCVDLSSEFIDDGIVAEYKREIVNMHFTMDRMGRLLIEPKEDIKARLGRSPDPADALMLAGLDRSEQDAPEMKGPAAEYDKKELARYARMMG